MTEPQVPEGMRRLESTVPLGTVINNNYAVTELLNIGGMGEVFRGENTFTGDPVAIKIVLRELAQDQNITSLFRREAKVLCGLSHPSVVRYFNFVRDEALDRYCLIMEYLEGRVLSDHVVDVAPLNVDEALRLMRRMAEGLAQVHEMGVIHRDLSPDNVILRGDEIDNAVLIDFGIAKSMQMSDETLHGQLAGKLKFISPEQLGHHDGVISPKTDIYGLALMIAYAIEGSPLPMGETVVEAVNARMAIPDLRHFDPRLRAILAYMLEPDPVDRPESMTEILDLVKHPARLPEKYRPLGPKVEPGSDTQAAMDVVFQPPKLIPGQLASNPSESAVDEPRSGGGFLRWLVVLALIAGVGGIVAGQQGWIGDPAEPEDVVTEVEEPIDDGVVTRASFLANFVETCGYATRVTSGPFAGTIAAFGQDETAFDELSLAYENAFDAAPAVQTYELTTAQCPITDFAKALRVRDGGAPQMILDSDVMQSDGTIVGRLSDRRGRPVWLALVTAAGGVYNLTDRLAEQPDGSATFTFGLTAGDGAEPQGQVLFALASDAPLIAAAAASEGASAQTLLPLIEAEIAGREGKAGLAIGYFTLEP
ncbi:MAG: serine/threonine-protein kinase [Pseudomonadota bacterium]